MLAWGGENHVSTLGSCRTYRWKILAVRVFRAKRLTGSKSEVAMEVPRTNQKQGPESKAGRAKTYNS